jgi:hypothetical protein
MQIGSGKASTGSFRNSEHLHQALYQLINGLTMLVQVFIDCPLRIFRASCGNSAATQ